MGPPSDHAEFGPRHRGRARRLQQLPAPRPPAAGAFIASPRSRIDRDERSNPAAPSATRTLLLVDERVDGAAFRPWLARQLRWSLAQLEDHHDFPAFRRAKPRPAAGFELLERDHDALHAALGGIAGRANTVLTHPDVDGAAFRSGLARFRDAQVELGRELGRHLDDEEDLLIPLILEHGERSPGGG